MKHFLPKHTSRLSTLLYLIVLPICFLLVVAAFFFTPATANSFPQSRELDVSCTQLDENTRDFRFMICSLYSEQ